MLREVRWRESRGNLSMYSWKVKLNGWMKVVLVDVHVCMYVWMWSSTKMSMMTKDLVVENIKTLSCRYPSIFWHSKHYLFFRTFRSSHSFSPIYYSFYANTNQSVKMPFGWGEFTIMIISRGQTDWSVHWITFPLHMSPAYTPASRYKIANVFRLCVITGESEDSYRQAQEGDVNEASFGHEALAGAASFGAFKVFEDRQRAEGTFSFRNPSISSLRKLSMKATHSDHTSPMIYVWWPCHK